METSFGMVTKFHFRRQAKDHHDAAELLLKLGDKDSVRYAALRLRMALECFAYETLHSFDDELILESMKTWQPGKLIKELREIDPIVDSDITLSFKPASMVEDNTAMKSLTDFRLSADWISRRWHKLGSLLHEFTVNQLRSQKYVSDDDAKDLVFDTLSEVKRVLASEVFAISIKLHIKHTCNCGFEIKRTEASIKFHGGFTCSNCNATWISEGSGSEVCFRKGSHKFTCPSCHTPNELKVEDLHHGGLKVCSCCGARYEVVSDWKLKPLN